MTRFLPDARSRFNAPRAVLLLALVCAVALPAAAQGNCSTQLDKNNKHAELSRQVAQIEELHRDLAKRREIAAKLHEAQKDLKSVQSAVAGDTYSYADARNRSVEESRRRTCLGEMRQMQGMLRELEVLLVQTNVSGQAAQTTDSRRLLAVKNELAAKVLQLKSERERGHWSAVLSPLSRNPEEVWLNAEVCREEIRQVQRKLYVDETQLLTMVLAAEGRKAQLEQELKTQEAELKVCQRAAVALPAPAQVDCLTELLNRLENTSRIQQQLEVQLATKPDSAARELLEKVVHGRQALTAELVGCVALSDRPA